MKTPMRYTHELYLAAVAADDVFQHALEERFGKNAGDARYLKLPADLEPLAQDFQRALDTYLAACGPVRDWEPT